MAKIRDKVLEFAKLAGECPENLQVVCFELLLKHHLEATTPNAGKTAGKPAISDPKVEDPEVEKKPTVEESATSQEDLSAADLHVKARHFIKNYGISLDQLNNLFYKENGEILPLYEDLKTTRMAESQVRIALLQALKEALTSGNFSADIESVRAECNDRKCYGRNNFGNNFTNNASLFDFDKYTREITSVKLSEDGRKELAEIISELQ